MHSDISPMSYIRGKCRVMHRDQLPIDIETYKREPDSFYYHQVLRVCLLSPILATLTTHAALRSIPAPILRHRTDGPRPKCTWCVEMSNFDVGRQLIPAQPRCSTTSPSISNTSAAKSEWQTNSATRFEAASNVINGHPSASFCSHSTMRAVLMTCTALNQSLVPSVGRSGISLAPIPLYLASRPPAMVGLARHVRQSMRKMSKCILRAGA